jgi:hypothetical protein
MSRQIDPGLLVYSYLPDLEADVGCLCAARRGTEFSRFLPLATDEGESQPVGGPCVERIGTNSWIKSTATCRNS